mmetsp:Transcript_8900/g.26667  ORF Transcript_8900/g.26667 Transcript_8900/m.26667 type:complete len:107 (+) Transcript_8900:589-909(+)
MLRCWLCTSLPSNLRDTALNQGLTTRFRGTGPGMGAILLIQHETTPSLATVTCACSRYVSVGLAPEAPAPPDADDGEDEPEAAIASPLAHASTYALGCHASSSAPP